MSTRPRKYDGYSPIHPIVTDIDWYGPHDILGEIVAEYVERQKYQPQPNEYEQILRTRLFNTQNTLNQCTV